jgi:polysaccharide deacetylase family protein (PEP-CTERM system associated)
MQSIPNITLRSTRRSAKSFPPAIGPAGPIVNAITIDVEDYFHVTAFEQTIAREAWNGFESRVCRNTERLLDMFEEIHVHGTFFVLGWVADRFPELVRRIAKGGHEIASHGYEHRLLYAMTPALFRDDLRRAKTAIESAAGRPVLGYRAPSFSVTTQSLWALDILAEEGYLYDASVYPIHHDRYGLPNAPRHPHEIATRGGSIWECPAATVRWAGMNMPFGGGGYFRILPYRWTWTALKWVNHYERRPAICYLHPWEIDPDQPRIPGPMLNHVRHYGNLAYTEPKLRRLLRDFSFAPLINVLRAGTEVPVARAAGTV